MKTTSLLALPLVALLGGCAANSVKSDAVGVEIGNDRPQNCRYLGEAVGSQGNFITGGITPNANLIEGARNALRNKAAAKGGNYVQVLDSSNASTVGANGNSSSTVVGAVFSCPNR